MAIPLPNHTTPILYHERQVWIKGAATGLYLPTDLQRVGGAAITLGQKATANSLPVTLPSDSRISATDRSNVASNVPAGTYNIGAAIPVAIRGLLGISWQHLCLGAGGQNRLTVDVFDGTTAVDLARSYMNSGGSDRGNQTFTQAVRPSSLNQGVTWQVRATIANITGAVNSALVVTTWWV